MSRINQSTLPLNAQNRKIFCAYHPIEILTNFCCDLDCLMPLCPSCIAEHTQQHFLSSNKPLYKNLHEILSETKQRCYQHIIIMEQLGRYNDRIFDYLTGLRQSIHNQLTENKQEIITQLNHIFDNYEEKLYTEAVKRYKDLEVYNRQQTIGITDFINTQIQTLHDQIAILKSQNCLAGLITYLANDCQIYEDSIKQLNQYAAKHKQAGKICINNELQNLQRALYNFCQNNTIVEYIDETIKQKNDGTLKDSQISKFGKSLLSHLGGTRQKSKENNINNSNISNENIVKKSEQYYKIEANEDRSSRILRQKQGVSSRMNLRNKY